MNKNSHLLIDSPAGEGSLIGMTLMVKIDIAGQPHDVFNFVSRVMYVAEARSRGRESLSRSRIRAAGFERTH